MGGALAAVEGVRGLADFYSSVAEASFALLGLWWVVLQIRHRDLLRDPEWRRMGYHISVYFLVIGAMSVVALITESTAFWRIAFGIGGALGGLESLQLIRSRSPVVVRSRLLSSMLPIAVALYVLIVVLAIAPNAPQDLGADVSAVAIEGVLFALLLFLGLNLAWLAFIRAALDHSGPEE